MSTQLTERPVTPTEQDRTPLVRLRGVKKYFPITRGIIFQKRIGRASCRERV